MDMSDLMSYGYVVMIKWWLNRDFWIFTRMHGSDFWIFGSGLVLVL